MLDAMPQRAYATPPPAPCAVCAAREVTGAVLRVPRGIRQARMTRQARAFTRTDDAVISAYAQMHDVAAQRAMFACLRQQRATFEQERCDVDATVRQQNAMPSPRLSRMMPASR